MGEKKPKAEEKVKVKSRGQRYAKYASEDRERRNAERRLLSHIRRIEAKQRRWDNRKSSRPWVTSRRPRMDDQAASAARDRFYKV